MTGDKVNLEGPFRPIPEIFEDIVEQSSINLVWGQRKILSPTGQDLSKSFTREKMKPKKDRYRYTIILKRGGEEVKLFSRDFETLSEARVELRKVIDGGMRDDGYVFEKWSSDTFAYEAAWMVY